MLQQIAIELTGVLLREEIVKEEDKEIYIYGFETMFSTAVNALLILTIAFLMGLVAETLVFLFCFAILRVYSGGYHAKTHLGCISTFALIYGCAMTVITLFPLQYAAGFTIIISMISLLFIWKYAPIEHKNRPFEGDEFKNFRQKTRIIALSETAIIIMISLFLIEFTKVALIMSIAMLCVVFILALAKIIDRKR